MAKKALIEKAKRKPKFSRELTLDVTDAVGQRLFIEDLVFVESVSGILHQTECWPV